MESITPGSTPPLLQQPSSLLRNGSALQEEILHHSVSPIHSLLPTWSVSSFSHPDGSSIHPSEFTTLSFSSFLKSSISQHSPQASRITQLPLYSINSQNDTHVRHHFQENILTSRDNSTFLPTLPQNIGVCCRDLPASEHRDIGVLHQARQQQQKNQQQPVIHYSKQQNQQQQQQQGTVIVQPILCSFNPQYQPIESHAPVLISPSCSLGNDAPYALPPRNSELVSSSTPPCLPMPTGQQLWSPIDFSGVEPELLLLPEEKIIEKTCMPQLSSAVQSSLKSSPQHVKPHNGQGKQHPTITQNLEKKVFNDYPSAVVSQGITGSLSMTNTTSQTSALVRPVPLRPIPVQKAGCVPPIAYPISPSVISSLTPVLTSTRYTIANSKEQFDMEQIRKTVKIEEKEDGATCEVNTMNIFREDVPNSSSWNSELTKQGEMIICEGDIDVAEQVVVETEKRKNLETERRKNLYTSKERKYEEYKEFVDHFKSYRESRGYSLEDVTQQVGSRYGKRISLRLITNFEDMALNDKKSYGALMETLRVWLRDATEASDGSDEDTQSIPTIATRQLNSILSLRLRNRRAWVNAQVARGLEEEFSRKANPTHSEVKKMAKDWNMEIDYIRTWFCNRRRRAKTWRITNRAASTQMLGLGARIFPQQVEGNKIPSLTHDITVEVPSDYSMDQYATSPYVVEI